MWTHRNARKACHRIPSFSFPASPFLIRGKFILHHSSFSLSCPWKCLCFLETLLRPRLTITVNSDLNTRFHMQMQWLMKPHFPLLPVGGSVGQASILNSTDIIRSSVPVPALPHLCVWQKFLTFSLISTREILPYLFLGLALRIKWDSGNECNRPYSNAKIVMTITPKRLFPSPFPQGFSRSRAQCLGS